MKRINICLCSIKVNGRITPGLYDKDGMHLQNKIAGVPKSLSRSLMTYEIHRHSTHRIQSRCGISPQS